MEEKRLFLTLEQALDVLPKSKEIHCFINAGFRLVGADWNRKEVEEAFNSSGYELSKVFYTSYDEKKQS